MVGERAHWEYLDALGGLDKRNTSHMRRGLPGLSHPRRPPKQIGGNGRQWIVTDKGESKFRGGSDGGERRKRKPIRPQSHREPTDRSPSRVGPGRECGP